MLLPFGLAARQCATREVVSAPRAWGWCPSRSRGVCDRNAGCLCGYDRRWRHSGPAEHVRGQSSWNCLTRAGGFPDCGPSSSQLEGSLASCRFNGGADLLGLVLLHVGTAQDFCPVCERGDRQQPWPPRERERLRRVQIAGKTGGVTGRTSRTRGTSRTSKTSRPRRTRGGHEEEGNELTAPLAAATSVDCPKHVGPRVLLHGRLRALGPPLPPRRRTSPVGRLQHRGAPDRIGAVLCHRGVRPLVGCTACAPPIRSACREE